ncbi:DUF4349 domain-containing protein [Aurantiacibacter aquimixticola]|uniref:DUF4349 domain-containing protein n=1 Tax=Aurantiacibacter aquimixticola TaxID=1958945 RepID=A0A419RQX2_9SPHN|nr:DUF4349 domain-containing protein [Aurantiacibacter aquimixticola]RJY08212.1 DUF4349 domain-containing protein [Aurantiacibacter aquimixticola]
MRQRIFLSGVAVACLALAACSEQAEYGDSVDMAETDVAAESVLQYEAASAPPASADIATLESRPDIPVNLPKMSYIYEYGFRLPAEDIADLQLRHADMCEARGPYVCQIVSQSHSGSVEDGYASGRLELAVIADQARSFGSDLSGAAETAGGEQVTHAITGQDLSKNMIDTEARLRSRIALRDRMMDVLRTRNGSVEELVEAERSVARINEEIDQARSWLEEMRGRVAYTRINIDYASAAAPATTSEILAPAASAISSIGTVLGWMLAFAIVIATIGLPVAAGVYGVRWAKARLKGPAEA